MYLTIISLSPLYLLGYIPAHNKIYLSDKHMSLYAYSLSLSVVEYQSAILRGDAEAAARILDGDEETPGLSKEERNKVARFLDEQGMWLFRSCAYPGLDAVLYRPEGFGTRAYLRRRP